MSAEVVVPMVMELVHPRSVTDLGCGLGTWLSVFREAGVEDVLGVDGEYVRLESLEIPKERFVAHDLRQPFAAGRRSDLSMSLEVAEHLSPEYAAPFVTTLTRLAPVVLFSAAVPGQGGTEHVNEQWPSYWAQLFRERGYLPVDCLRRHLWDRPSSRGVVVSAESPALRRASAPRALACPACRASLHAGERDVRGAPRPLSGMGRLGSRPISALLGALAGKVTGPVGGTSEAPASTTGRVAFP